MLAASPESDLRKRLPLFGISLWLGAFAFLYFVYGAAISLEHSYFRMVFMSRKVDANLGMAWFLAGLIGFLVSAVFFIPGWLHKRLVISGPYRWCRHPMYAALILGILPALGLMAHSSLVMSDTVVAYVFLKCFIAREDRSLTAAFGASYMAYRAGTNELFPWPRRRQSPERSMKLP